MVTHNDILDYINFLICKQKLYVSLHGDIAKFSSLSKNCMHTHPLCVHIKHSCGMLETCRAQQKKVLEHCKNGTFFGVCHAGMGEFIYPLTNEGCTFGFISVSGYLANTEHGKALQNEFITKTKNSFYVPPEQKEIDSMLRPLVLMCEAYYNLHKSELINNSLISTVVQYINKNFTYDITMESLSKKFNYSVSTISHHFKAETGVSLNKYIENLRIKSAKNLLMQTTLQVTEISLSLGFCNSAYFSTLFKKSVGMTPSEYRHSKNNVFF